ncbi:MAG: FtsX-like permease family protein [Acidobacteriota bacterium]
MISYFLARRYLLASRRDAQVGVVALAAFLGLALGVAALVVSLALLAGFQTHVRSRLLSETPHLLVTPAGRGVFHDADRVGGRIAEVPGVVSVSPVARGRVWVSMGRDAAPAEVVGREKTKGLVLDVAQARPLGIVPGESVTLVSSRSRLSPLGPIPIVSTMQVTGLAPASTGRRAAEASLPLDEARRLFALGPDGATGYEVFLKDAAHPGKAAAAVAAALGPTVAVTTWEEQNRALVLALRLERFVLFAAVFLIVIVAGLNLAATSAVLAATRAGDAAVLSVLGASPKTVERVFRAAGGGVGLAGTLLGVVLGVSVATLLERFGVVPLPTQLYGMNHAPFRVDPFDVAAVAALSILWAFVVASVPARTAARQPAVEALRGA